MNRGVSNGNVRTYSVVPHITDAIQEWVTSVSKRPVTNDGKTPDVSLWFYVIIFKKSMVI